MHCSKCTNIIKKVLCPHLEDQKRDIGGNGYRFLLDESNDIFIWKILRIPVIYYSHNCGNVV